MLTVTDVHEQAGIIWHMVPSLPAGAVPGAEAAQAIDWAWRFDKMQQHTGEHILSGILHSMFGAENVGFHIGSDAVRMDTNIPISAEGLKAAETAANRIIWENVPVNITYPTREDILADIRVGMNKGNPDAKFVEIPDRLDALHYAVDHAQEGDLIAVIGKGHETYRDREGVKTPFLERELLEEYAQQIGLE